MLIQFLITFTTINLITVLAIAIYSNWNRNWLGLNQFIDSMFTFLTRLLKMKYTKHQIDNSFGTQILSQTVHSF